MHGLCVGTPIKAVTLSQFVHFGAPFLPWLLRLAIEAIANEGDRRRLEGCCEIGSLERNRLSYEKERAN
jgi:hypothetical protein